MPELKNTFTGGKMNKDLDERLVKNGEYRHAINIQVRTTDSSSDGDGAAGTVQNIKGNEDAGGTYYSTWMTASSDIPNPPTCVGSIADEKKDKAYFLFASPFIDYEWDSNDGTFRNYVDTIVERDINTGQTKYVVVDKWAILARAPGVLSEWTDETYMATGWNELKVYDGSLFRPGMNISIYAIDGTIILNNSAKIKAIDGNVILLHETQYTYLNPATAYWIKFNSPRVLNFSDLRTGIRHVDSLNIIDDFLIWTDGRSEPKKIHIPRCIAGTNINGVGNDGTKHTKLYVSSPNNQTTYVDANTLQHNLDTGANTNGSGVDSYLKEEHITVIKKAPTYAPTIEMKEIDRDGSVDVDEINSLLISEGQDTLAVNSIIIVDDSAFGNTTYRPNDVLIFTYTGGDGDSVRVRAIFLSYINQDGEEVNEPTDTIKVNIISVPTDINISNYQIWSITLELRKPIYELKLGRFGYRYRYNDGEYSSFSPWSELAFLPSDFDYVISKAYNVGMVNHAREMIVRGFIPYKIPLDVKEVDILYKPTTSANVYIVDTMKKGLSPEWELYTPDGTLETTEIKTGELTITSEMIHRVLPSNQTLRAWDNVPRKALTQEITGNRLLFANYIQGYDIKQTINLKQNIVTNSIIVDEFSQPATKSIKSMRDYKVGMVFGDKYGRETPVISSGYTFTTSSTEDEFSSETGDIIVEKQLCANKNSLTVQQEWSNDDPHEYFDYVKYYVKETSNEYYNLIMDRWYDSGDGTIWLSFNSADRNKVDEETYLLLKNKHGNQEPVLEKARYKIIAIENEAPEYIKTTNYIVGELGQLEAGVQIGAEATGVVAQDGSGDGLFGIIASTDIGLDIFDSGTTPSLGPPQGLITGNSCQFGAAFWADAGFTLSGYPAGDSAATVTGYGLTRAPELRGKLYCRVVGINWVYDPDTLVSVETYRRESKWSLITNTRAVGTDGVRITWADKFYSSADHYTWWTTSADVDTNGDPLDIMNLVYTMEFKEAQVINKPEFDGKFFVKIEKDEVLRSGVMTLGQNTSWQDNGTFNLSYIESTMDNQAKSGAWAGNTANFNTNNDVDYFYGQFDVDYSYLNSAQDAWYPAADCPADWFETAVIEWSGENVVGPYGSTYSDYNSEYGLGFEVYRGMGTGWLMIGAPSGGGYSHTFGYGTGGGGTAIGSSANGGDYTKNFYYEGIDFVGINDLDQPTMLDCQLGYATMQGSPYGVDSNNMPSWKNPDFDNDEINVLANQGLFASCTWAANFHTNLFWMNYRPDTAQGIGVAASTKNNAFIDGAKARKLDLPGDDNPNFYKPDSMFSDGAGTLQGNATMGGMTISMLTARDSDAEGNSGNGIFDKLRVGNYFKIGTSDFIYKILSVNGNYDAGYGGSRYGWNYSLGSSKPVATDGYPGTDSDPISGGCLDYNNLDIDSGSWVYGSNPGIYYENCKLCEREYDNNPRPFDYSQPNSYGCTWPSCFGPWKYSYGEWMDPGSFVDDWDWDRDTGGCTRRTRQITFRRVEFQTGDLMQVVQESGESATIGIDVENYDPRGDMRHDGIGAIKLQFMVPTPVFFNDDSPKNELGACWETEPKEDTDLDIYYEASSAIPLRLTESNAFNFAPINSKVDSIDISGGGEVVKSMPYSRSDVKVSNIHMIPFADSTYNTQGEAIITVMSRSFFSSDFTLHRGPYDEDGGLDTSTPDLVSLIHINVGDKISFTHSDGTVTRAKVTSYYDLVPVDGANEIDPEDWDGDVFPEGGTQSFNVASVNETNYVDQLTSGPKSFVKTISTYPTGYYGISIETWREKVDLPWFNCYAFGNGVESDRVRDDYNAPQIDNGVRVSTTFSGYGAEKISSGLIYSGLYNSTSQVNNLNEFNMAEKITKELNPSYGQIKRLKSRDTDMVVFTEDKVLRLLANKDAVYNADGKPQLTATDRVLGTPIPYSGEFGISQNPESLAWDQYRMYFTDRQRGAVLRLSKDGLTPISNVGMKSWFRENLKVSDRLIGSFDGVNGEYNLTLIKNDNSADVTLSFNENSKGWVSFKSFIQDGGLFVSGTYLTTKEDKIWEHYSDSADRNSFYGEWSMSKIVMLFNEDPNTVKSFKSFNYDGSQSKINSFSGATVIGYTGDVIFAQTDPGSPSTNLPNITNITGSLTNFVNVTDNEYYNLVSRDGWYCPSASTNLEFGRVVEFKNKEDKWFGQISGLQLDYDLGTHMSIQTDQFSVQGLGVAAQVKYIQDNDEITDDCVPACPPEEGLMCVEGECVEVFQIVYGCTDSTQVEGNYLASNYNPEATVDDGSCVYTLVGCMDPIANNYGGNSVTQTYDTLYGTLGTDWTNACQPFCVNCNPYALGCMDNVALNYSPGATTDGYCLFQGIQVPCPGYLVTGVDQPGYNADAWDDTEGGAENVGLYDDFVFSMGFSCFYEGTCGEDEVWDPQCNNGAGCCVEAVEGCCLPDYAEFNPAATICNNDLCLTIDVIIQGCLDPTACNYGNVPNANTPATAGPFECEWSTCMGCMDVTACNYDSTATSPCVGPYVDDESSPGYGTSTCCFWDCDNADYIPGCLTEGYAEYCGDQTNQWEELGMAGPCNMDCWEGGPCGQYQSPIYNGNDIVGYTTAELGSCLTPISETEFCEETNADWIDYMPGFTLEVTNNGEIAPCTYQIFACNDSAAWNYVGDNFADNLPPNTTIINVPEDCNFSYGCTNPDAYNYNPDAVLDDLSCRPSIAGCMDINAINYSPFHTYDPGVPTLNDYTDYNRAMWSWEYGGDCIYWNYGCMDPAAQNYDPTANTSLNWTAVSNDLYDSQWWRTRNFTGHVLGGDSSDNFSNNIDDGAAAPTMANMSPYQANLGQVWYNELGNQLTSPFDAAPLDPAYYPNQYGIAVDLFDIYYAPGQSWRWVETGWTQNGDGSWTGLMGIEGCDGCNCLQYGESNQYVKVQVHAGDMTNDFPADLDNGQG